MIKKVFFYNRSVWNDWVHKSYWFLVAITSGILLFIYRGGAARVDGTNKPGIRDFGIYLEAARDIYSGENPYDNIAYRSGSFGSIIFYPLNAIDSNTAIIFAVQILNLLGFMLFLRTVYDLLGYKKHAHGYLAILWTASLRENLVTAQITGILLGLLSLAYLLLKYYKTTKSKTAAISASILAAISLDIKPHIVFPLAIILFTCKSLKRDYLIIFIALIMGHLIQDLRLGRILEMEMLTNLNGAILQEPCTLRDSQSIWPFVLRFGASCFQIHFFSTTFYVLSVCIATYFARKSDTRLALLWACVAPTLYAYNHLLDFAGIAIVITALMVTKNNTLMFLSIFPLLLFPLNLTNFQNLVIAISLMGLILGKTAINIKLGCFAAGCLFAQILWQSYLIELASYDDAHKIQCTVLALFGLIAAVILSFLKFRRNQSKSGKV